MCGIVGYLNRSGSGAGRPHRLDSPGDAQEPGLSGTRLGRRRHLRPHPDTESQVAIKLNGASDLRDSADRARGIVSRRLPSWKRTSSTSTCNCSWDRWKTPSPFCLGWSRTWRTSNWSAAAASWKSSSRSGRPPGWTPAYGISQLTGTHGIGHTRLSTESRVDLSHSQPFGVHGVADLATVHNGHITNYHKLRGRYEQMGVRLLHRERLGGHRRLLTIRCPGPDLPEALESSLDDFDGSFSYLAASGNEFAYAKDRFGFKPLLVAESEDWVAIATEEIALRSTLTGDFDALEPGVNQIRIWSLPQPDAETV